LREPVAAGRIRDLVKGSRIRVFGWTALFVVAIGLAVINYRELVSEVLINIPSAPVFHETALASGSTDARVYSWAGTYYLLSTEDRDPQKALWYFKKAVELNPLYYQHWSEIGAAYEMLGDYDNAVDAYRNTVTLSPNSYQSHWSLANCLLRKGDYDQSVVEFRRYLEIDRTSAGYVFDLLNRVNGDNLEKMSRDLLPLSGPARADLALFIAGKGDATLAVNTWQGMSGTDKQESKEQGLRLVGYLLTVRDYDRAKTIWSEFAPKNETGGPVVNGSFENPIEDYPSGFGWRFSAGKQPAISLSADKPNRGKQSLLLNFSAVGTHSPEKLEQLVAPLTGGVYKLSYSAKATDLAIGATPMIEVFGEDGKALVSDQPAQGTFDWTHREAIFTVTADQKAVKLSIAIPDVATSRTGLAGKLWLDDFSIEKR